MPDEESNHDSTLLLYFADESRKSTRSLRALLAHSKQSTTLAKFFDRSLASLRECINVLPSCYQARLGPLTSFYDLIDIHDAFEIPDAVCSAVLLCVVQLAFLLLRAERDNAIFSSSRKKIALGLCTGQISAVAACTSNLSQMLEVGQELLHMSLRLGIAVSERSRDVDNRPLSWAWAFSNVDATELEKSTRDFNQSQHLPSHRKLYISARSSSSSTICGPPSSLEWLRRSDSSLAGKKSFVLPIRAAYHAPHLSRLCVDNIIGSSPVFEQQANDDVIFVSPGKARPVSGTNTLRDLLRVVCSDVLERPVQLQDIEESFDSWAPESSIEVALLGQRDTPSFLSSALACRSYYLSKDELNRQERDAQGTDNASIAVVGMSCRFSGASNPEELWNVIRENRDLCQEVPSDRFNLKSHYDPTGDATNTTTSKWGCFIDCPGLFDAHLFRLTPREVRMMDPAHRLMLLTTYEALEQAGYSRDRTLSTRHESFGTFFGQTLDDWREVNSSQEIDPYFFAGSNRAFGPGRVSYHFGWEGPSISVDTACSSSTVAINQAVSALRSGECSSAVAGGANIMTNPDIFAGLSRSSFISPTGGCRTFAQDADGYCRADGVGCFVLKRLRDAELDNDRILAVIKGIATNHSADAASITQPHSATQAKLMRKVLDLSNTMSSEISYVEMHGTGTQVGDARESLSVSNVLLETPRTAKLFVGSVKPFIGHTEAASGVASMIKAIKMFEKQVVPAQIMGPIEFNQNLPAHFSDCIPRAEGPFKPVCSGQPRKILINNFNAAGGNTSLLLEEYLEQNPHKAEQEKRRALEVIAVSACTSTSLKHCLQDIERCLSADPRVSLTDLAYTSTCRRMHHSRRKAYTAADLEHLRRSIKHDLDSSKNIDPGPVKQQSKIMFAFVGQGVNVVGLASDLYDSCSTFREALSTFNTYCKEQHFPEVLEILKDQKTCKEQSSCKDQLALVAFETALYEVLLSYGFRPDLVVGHSLGEYTSLYAAGAINKKDLVFLVGTRARLMDERCTPNTHAMLVVHKSADDCRKALAVQRKSQCAIACLNGPTTTVISGPEVDVQIMEKELRDQNVSTSLISVPFAFHSTQVDTILDDYAKVVNTIPLMPTRIPIASTVRGRVLPKGTVLDPDYLVQQARRPVLFSDAIQSAVSVGNFPSDTICIEVGPTSSVKMIRSIIEPGSLRLLQTCNKPSQAWQALSDILVAGYEHGVDINWNAHFVDCSKPPKLLDMPAYAFDMEDYWLPYEGHWTLTKGQKGHATASKQHVMPSSIFTELVHESVDGDQMEYCFATDLTTPEIRELISGHSVNKTPLCPSSVFAEMAYAAAAHVMQNGSSETDAVNGVELTDMHIMQPLTVLQGLLRTTIRTSQGSEASLQHFDVCFETPSSKGITKHATAMIKRKDIAEARESWKRIKYLLQSRISQMIDPQASARIDHMFRRTIYQLFGRVVDYSDDYQGLDEVFVESANIEGVAVVKLPECKTRNRFVFYPQWIDALLQLAGFVLNGCNETNSDKTYISTGWQSLHLMRSLEQDTSYTVHVKFQRQDASKLVVGDLYAFDRSGDAVAICQGIAFQKLNRAVVEHILRSNDDAAPSCESDRGRRRDEQSPKETNIPTINQSSQDTADASDDLLAILESETGFSRADLHNSSTLYDIGIDSIVSITISSRLRKAGFHSASVELLSPSRTLGDLEQELLGNSENTDSRSTSATGTQSSSDISQEDNSFSYEIKPSDKNSGDEYQVDQVTCKSVDSKSDENLHIKALMRRSTQKILKTVANEAGDRPRSYLRRNSDNGNGRDSASLSGPPRKSDARLLQSGTATPSRMIFLLPDGSGSAASYANIQDLGKDITAWAIDSPFQHIRKENCRSLKELVSFFVTVIQGKQAEGPYHLGGWSLGGTFALEVARRLLETGENVATLILIDAPCFNVVPPMELKTLDIMKSLGVLDSLFGAGQDIFEAFKRRFELSLEVVQGYEAEALNEKSKAIHCAVIWASKGLADRLDTHVDSSQLRSKIDDPGAQWLWQRNQDRGELGQSWKSLLPSYHEYMVEGDHFSIMKTPQVTELSRAIRQALE